MMRMNRFIIQWINTEKICPELTMSDVNPSSTVRFDSLLIISCAINSHSTAFAEIKHGTWPEIETISCMI